MLSGDMEEFLNRLQNIFCFFLDQSSHSQCSSRTKDVKTTFMLLFLLYSGPIQDQNCSWLTRTRNRCIACIEAMWFFFQTVLSLGYPL